MSAILPAIAAVLGGAFLLLMGSGLLSTTIGVRTVLEQFPIAITGLVMAAYFAGLIAGTLWCRGLVRRVGHIRAFTAFAAAITIFSLVHAYAVDPYFWMVLRAGTGFSFAGLYIVIESWLNARATNETRGRILSIYMIVSYSAVAVGQFLLLLASPVGFELFGLAAILFCMALIPIALTRASQPELPAVRRFSPRKLILASPLGFAAAVAGGVASGALYGMGPVFAATAVVKIASVSAFMGIVIAGGLVLQWPVGRLSDLVDRRKVIVAVAVLAGLLSLGTAVATYFSTLAIILLAGAGGGLSLTLYSLAVAHTNDYVAGEDLMEASAGLLLSWGAGSMVGPIAAALAMTLAGASGLFFLMAVALFAVAGFGLYRMTRREALPPDEQTAFVALPRTSTEALQLDPRAHAEEEDPRDSPAGRHDDETKAPA